MNGSGHRVLVVDDSADSAEPLSMLLETKGHQTRIVTEGEEALRVAADFQPSIVLLDIGLPRMDGYEVARQLRERPDGKKVVLVALTGWAGKEARAKAAEAGFDYHLVKPVDFGELERIVASVDSDARR